MTSNWPEKITFHFSESGGSVSGLIVYLAILTVTKNHYSIGPLTVGEGGCLTLHLSDIRESMNRDQVESPMDYDAEIEDCIGFELLIESGKDLLDRVERLEGFYPESASDLKRKIEQSTNSGLSSFIQRWYLPLKETDIEIELESI